MNKYDNLIKKTIFDFCDDERVLALFVGDYETREEYLDSIDITPSDIYIPPIPQEYNLGKQDILASIEAHRWGDLLRLAEIIGDESLARAVFEQCPYAADIVFDWGEEDRALQREYSSYPSIDLSHKTEDGDVRNLLFAMGDIELNYTLRSNPEWCTAHNLWGVLLFIGADWPAAKCADLASAPIVREAIRSRKDVSICYDDGESCDGSIRGRSIIAALIAS